MAKHLQKEFEEFHLAIKLVDGTENAVLRGKRDLLLSDLRDGLKRIFDKKGLPVPKFDSFNQGSYWMGTGIKPLDGDYDIDIGLKFHFSKDTYQPVDVKTWVLEALNTGNRTVLMKRPCVRVQYHKGGEPAYHVDLAVYCQGDSFWDRAIYLAKGHTGSAANLKIWEEAEPDRLKEIVNSKFSQPEDERQFERVIRYLKRWKDYQFGAKGNAAPTGIAITALALELFRPESTRDFFEGKTYYNDLEALHGFVKKIIARFSKNWINGEYVDTISVKLPVMPRNELFEKMSSKQQGALKTKLESLRDTLNAIIVSGGDPHDDAETLQKEFGPDFSVPPKKETAKPNSKPYISSSQSA